MITLDVSDWPLRWRRRFILTLPLSGPLWLAAYVVVMIGMLVIFAVLSPIVDLEKLWRKKPHE